MSGGVQVVPLLFCLRRVITLYLVIAEKDGTENAVCDSIAGMTDRYAVMTFQKLFQPKFWQG